MFNGEQRDSCDEMRRAVFAALRRKTPLSPAKLLSDSSILGMNCAPLSRSAK
jgi:hypothetical protein